MKRVEFVMNIPSPYRVHLLTEMWHQLEDRGIAFHVHFMRWGYDHLPPSWKNPKIDFPHTIWKDHGIGIYNFNPRLVWRMVFNPPDVMVCGSSFDTITGILICLFGRSRTKVAWVEGNTKTPGQMNGLRGWLKRLVFGHCDYAAVPGKDGERYIALHQALTTKKMPLSVYLPNLVDEIRFRPREEYSNEVVDSIREALGVMEADKLIITPARMVVDKGLVPYLSLLDNDLLHGWKQVIIGAGPLIEEVRATVVMRGIADAVRIIETVPYSEMPKYYAAADLFLLPSVHDQNPLSVVEALHSGLPIALTTQAGNVEEAVTEGKNGWILPVMDQVKFKLKLKEVFAADKATLKRMGGVSKSVNSRFWNTKESVVRFVEAIV